MRRLLWLVGLTLPVLATVASATAASASAPTVRPGGVVRWSGPGTERCGLDGEVWAPVGEACVFPVDLLRTGTLTVARWAGGTKETRQVAVGKYPYAEQRITLQDDSKVNLSKADEARADRESAQVGKLWGLRSPRRFVLPLVHPLATAPEGGRFGARRVFNGQPRNPHNGADYSAAAGTPVRAPADGVVVLAADHFFSGKSVFLDHGDGLITMLFHLSEIAVAKGQEVRAGQLLGKVGATGRATGPHLHLGVRWRGARIDPAALFAPVEGLPAVGE